MAYEEVFSALADPTRRHIFEALRRQPKTVGELAEGQAVSRPAVSQHLKVLESASLVSVEPQGNRRLYSIKRDGLDDLRRIWRVSGRMPCRLTAPKSRDA